MLAEHNNIYDPSGEHKGCLLHVKISFKVEMLYKVLCSTIKSNDVQNTMMITGRKFSLGIKRALSLSHNEGHIMVEC